MRSTCLTTDLGAIARNLHRIRARLAPGVKLVAVVKADAYGHGATHVAARLEQEGADMFAVAILEEALALRAARVQRPVLVLGGVSAADAGEAVRARASVAVYDEGALEALERAARAQGAFALAHLKVDTGMTRVGVCEGAELEALLARWRQCPHVQMEGAFTHFADAEGDAAFTQAQNAAFDRALARVRAAGFSPLAHAAATGAACDAALARDAVRPGIGLYGYCMPGVEGLETALRLSAKPLRFAWIKPGDTVGYGRAFCAGRPTRIMTVPVGYGDGYPRMLGGRADVLVCGRRAPVVGRVCMDMLMADVTDIPQACLDSEVVLLGAQGSEAVDAQELAGKCGTIPYEILLGFSARVRRAFAD